jgi:hypothetical protein
VKHGGAGAEIFAHGHLGNDFFWRGADEFDPQQLGKG